MRSGLTILGAGGHGRIVAELAELNGYKSISFLDNKFGAIKTSGIWPVIGLLEDANKYGDIALGIGNNANRIAIAKSLIHPAVTLIHPTAIISRYATIGAGSIVCAGAIIGPFVQIGAACIVNSGASIDHDCHLSCGCHISPGARIAGGVTVGVRSWVGIGSCVREGIQVGSDVIIGAGAAVIRDVDDGMRVGGIPAKEF